jgi:AraC-like DNA-binding protein
MDNRAIRRVHFDNPQRPALPIEVVSFAELRHRAPVGALARPLRPNFHQVVFVTKGRFAYEVDFERRMLAPGQVVWVTPGQVQRLDLPITCKGWLLLFTADAVDQSTLHFELEPPPKVVLGSRKADIVWLLSRVRRLVAHEAREVPFALVRHLVSALLVLLRQAAGEKSSTSTLPAHPAYVLFRAEVERRFAETRRLYDYERVLGYCAKTLTRATLAATGQNAKQYIDQRVALEARRLLCHNQDNVATIASKLGFSEPTNFVKFFRRHAGVSPAVFRAGFLADTR